MVLTFVVIIGLLVVLNLVTFVKDSPKDTEINANRSTFNSGPTGSRAIYDFLSESGYKVMRWRERPQELLAGDGKFVSTFVLVGRPQVPYTEEEAKKLLTWVNQGGRFVLVDRWPDQSLLPTSHNWQLTSSGFNIPEIDTDPANPREMTEGTVALSPAQPTALTRSVQSIMPSRFASRIQITYSGAKSSDSKIATQLSPAPVVHFSDKGGALLVDYIYGKGRIALLSDPYIISNGGISLKDNLLLAVNTFGSSGGLIAFDEFHQGRGVTQNEFASYFSGTPVIAIAAQIALLTILILWGASRRFARPLPLAVVDRRSSLEFVASMAELEERSKAFDLAIENIYSRTRRVLARYAGVNYNSPRSLIASQVALRSSVDPISLENLMQECEDVINGEPVSSRRSLELVKRIRELERKLGLLMRSRDARQAAEKI